MNVIAKSALSWLNLKVEPHPDPFKVQWIDKTTLPMNESCLVPIQMGDYNEKIYCDVLSMKVAHILLCRPWIYDHNVTNNDKENTYVFIHKEKRITLTPEPLEQPLISKSYISSQNHSSRQPQSFFKAEK